MLAGRKGIMTLSGRWLLCRAFAKKKTTFTKTVEVDEYDLTTALQLLKASAVRPVDESIDIMIK